VEEALQHGPFSEQLFVFCNRKRDKIKILCWERNGFCLWAKRLERARFKWPRSEKIAPDQIRLFDEAEVDAEAQAEAMDTITVPEHTRQKRGRRKLPES